MGGNRRPWWANLAAALASARATGKAASREREERRLKDARRRSRAKDTASLIGFDAMYKDGIAQVEEGLFSQTLELSDISYQSARDDMQESVFMCMCGLYNYFDADVSVQLTVANTPIPLHQVGRREFFPPAEGPVGSLADEYNRILNDKMREGVSNMERHRYLTYLVGADDVDAAVPKLSRIRGDVSARLSHIRCEAVPLDGCERLRAIHSMVRPGKRFEFGWDKLSQQRGLRAKDLIAPGIMDFSPGGRADCFESDGMLCSALYIRDLGSVVADNYLSSIIDLPIPLAVSIHIQPIAQTEALAEVNEKIAWIDKEIDDNQTDAVRRGHDQALIPSELAAIKTDAEQLKALLEKDKQSMFSFLAVILTYADTIDALERQVGRIKDTYRGNSMAVEPLHYRQKQGMNSMLPLGRNHLDLGRRLITGQVAMQMPFASQELNQPGGGYYGQSKQSGNLVICNRKDLASPMGFVCGKPGSGKSFSVKREILNTILAHPRDEVIVFDPAGEYGTLMAAVDGTAIRFAPDADTHMNPFALSDVEGLANATQMAFKIDAFLALSSAMMAEGLEGLPEADKSIITRCVEAAYAVSPGTPTLQDFYDILKKQPEREAADIALRYERYVSGALSFFNRQSNVRLGARVTNVDLHDLSSSMRVFGMLTALEAVRNRMYANFERGVTTWLYIDEVQSLFGHPAIIEYFAKFWAEGRKFNLICTGITQNSTYMLAHETARNLVLNSDFILLHKQSALDRRSWVDLLSLSDEEAACIDDFIKPGEGLLVAGGVRIPLRDDFPKSRLYDLFNTKPDEIAELKAKASALRDAGSGE